MYQLTWMKIPLRDWCVQHIRSLHWEVVWMCGWCGCTNMIVSKPYKGVRLNLGYLSIRPQPISQPREHPIEVPGQIQKQSKNYIQILISIKSTWVSDTCRSALSQNLNWVQNKYKLRLKYVFVYQNIARIANAVQAALWCLTVSYYNPQIEGLNVMIKVSQFVGNSQRCH